MKTDRRARTSADRALPAAAVWLFAALTASPLDAQETPSGTLWVGAGLGAGGVTAREGTVAGLTGSARLGVDLSRTVAAVLEGDIARLIDGDPDPANFSGDFDTEVFRTTHLLLSAQITTSERTFLRPGLGLGIHDLEVGRDCDPIADTCAGAERATEGGYAAGLTWGYSLASAAPVGWSVELMTRVSDTEDGTRFTFGVLLVASLGPAG
jgi:hypothetical protein